MKVSADRVIHGVIQYADEEVLRNLPTTGKWLLGTGIGITSAKANDVIYALNDNAIVKMIGVVDDDGLFDVDLIMDNMKDSAQKYGKITFQVPLIGRMTFSESDIDLLRNYIER